MSCTTLCFFAPLSVLAPSGLDFFTPFSVISPKMSIYIEKRSSNNGYVSEETQCNARQLVNKTQYSIWCTLCTMLKYVIKSFTGQDFLTIVGPSSMTFTENFFCRCANYFWLRETPQGTWSFWRYESVERRQFMRQYFDVDVLFMRGEIFGHMNNLFWNVASRTLVGTW